MADGTARSQGEPNYEPHNVAAEIAVLGAIIYNNDVFTLAAEKLGAGDFYSDANRKIWTVLSDVILSGKTATGVSLREHFESDGQLAELGGARYLAELIEGAAFGPEIKDFADIIRDCAIRRRIIAAGDSLITAALKAGEPGRLMNTALTLASAIEEIESVAVTVTPDTWRDSRLETIQALTEAARGAQSGGIETGLEPLDRILGGLFRGDLVVIGGRPSMGKSALCDQIEMNVADRTRADGSAGVVAKFSLEMDGRQLAYRNASRAAHKYLGQAVEYRLLRRGRLDKEHERAFLAALERLPLVHWDVQRGIDLSHIRTQLLRLKKRYGRIDLITCDYLQIMEIHRERGQTDAAAIGAVTRGLKKIAGDFDAPVVALSQLSRKVEEREDKRPMLSDLRDSGSIEADADSVVFCYREVYYLERSPVPKDADKKAQREAQIDSEQNCFDVIVAKQRNGPLATAKLYWSPETSYVASTREQVVGRPGVQDPYEQELPL